MGKVNKPQKNAKKEPFVMRSGTVLTEELAEKWAEEIEQNPPDPSKLERRYVGRPSLGPKGLSPRVSFRVPPDLYKAAWARADKEGRSLSELAREAFNRYMNTDS
jgi:hypothetical protein